jgi:hypothetical protein
MATFAHWPECQSLVDRIRRALQPGGPAVEQLLENARSESDALPHVAAQLLGLKAYLTESIGHCNRAWQARAVGMTNYLSLIEEIERWRRPSDEKVLLVTFNYDTLLEEAVARIAGVKFRTIDDYVSVPSWLVIKPHGSVNWHRQITLPSRSAALPTGYRDKLHALIETRANWRFTDAYAVQEPGGSAEIETQYAFPALSIPVQSKTHSDFECPPDHLHALRRALPAVTRVLIVGWRGLEEHFMGEWQRAIHGTPRLAKLGLERYCIVTGSPEESRGVNETLSRWLPTKNEPLQALGSFSQFVGGDQLKHFLK